MNKKGAEAVGSYSVFLIIAAIALAIIALVTAMFFFSYKSDFTKTNPVLESTMISARFYNQKECFAYQDTISERTYSKIIDTNKFTKQTLDNCYFTEDTKQYHFKLTLKNLDTGKDTVLQTLGYYNVPKFTLKQDVLIKQGDELSKGHLLIVVQTPI